MLRRVDKVWFDEIVQSLSWSEYCKAMEDYCRSCSTYVRLFSLESFNIYHTMTNTMHMYFRLTLYLVFPERFRFVTQHHPVQPIPHPRRAPRALYTHLTTVSSIDVPEHRQRSVQLSPPPQDEDRQQLLRNSSCTCALS